MIEYSIEPFVQLSYNKYKQRNIAWEITKRFTEMLSEKIGSTVCSLTQNRSL